MMLAATATALGQIPPAFFSMALSESVVGNVNVNDARAAMRVWISRISKEVGLTVRISPEIFENAATFPARLREGSLDSIAVTLLEYMRLSTLLDAKQITIPMTARRLEYTLLVNSGSGIAKLADLKDRKISVLDATQASVLPAWLWTLVHPLEPAGPGKFFSSIARETRPGKAILPVFFGQMDACVVTSENFATMADLNPQMGKRLISLAVSPEIVPSLYGFRKGWDERSRERVRAAMADIGNSTSGRQVLTLFQINGLASRDPSYLESTLAIVRQAERAGYKAAPLGGGRAAG